MQKTVIMETNEACKGIEHLIDYLLTDSICNKMNQLLISQIINALLEIADKHDAVKEFISNNMGFLTTENDSPPPQIMIDKSISAMIENATGEWLNTKVKFLQEGVRFKVDYGGKTILAKLIANNSEDKFVVAIPLFGQDIMPETDDAA